MNDTCETLSERYSRQDSYGVPDPRWYEKMVHVVADAPVVDRASYCTLQLAKKRVLSLGHSGGMAHMVDGRASEVYSVDLQPWHGSKEHFCINLDEDPASLPDVDVDIVFAGETFEHMANPGNVLKTLRKYACPLLATVPNAFSQGALDYAKRGIECVNPDHVAWYSWWTFTNLLGRYGFRVKEFRWYNGRRYTAEGLIVLTE